MARKESIAHDGQDGIDNYELPRAVVSRIAKSAVCQFRRVSDKQKNAKYLIEIAS